MEIFILLGVLCGIGGLAMRDCNHGKPKKIIHNGIEYTEHIEHQPIINVNGRVFVQDGHEYQITKPIKTRQEPDYEIKEIKNQVKKLAQIVYSQQNQPKRINHFGNKPQMQQHDEWEHDDF